MVLVRAAVFRTLSGIKAASIARAVNGLLVTGLLISPCSAQPPEAENTPKETEVSVPVDPGRARATQEADSSEADSSESESAASGKVSSEGLQFAFEGAPWRDVMKWLADESDLALHVGDLPTGSFTYSDPASFTPQEAIDRVNLFLIPQGYTIIQSGRLLSVIDLGDARSAKQLDALAQLVKLESLVDYESHRVVKCFFPLEELKAEEAVEELQALNLMLPPAVFEKTNQLLITDTVGNLRKVQSVLDSFEPTALDNGTVVKNFPLKHVESEDVLVVARPHLGLATGEMIGIDVSLSSDPQGKSIFVTGLEDKVKLIEGLINAIDVPDQKTEEGEEELRVHLVEGGDVELVHSVLQTLLSGKSLRLSMDKQAGGIVALAAPSIQKEIEATVKQLQSADAEFEVIPLRNVDPYFAVSLLQEMLDIPDPLMSSVTKSSSKSSRDSGANSPTVTHPKIDADAANMRLFVRGKRYQIEEIKKIVAGLDDSSAGRPELNTEQIRIFPLKGQQAEEVLETAAKFWREPNTIVLFQTSQKSPSLETERVLHAEDLKNNASQKPAGGVVGPNTRVLSDSVDSKEPLIRCQLTPRGLLLQSDDSEALDKFEELLRTIAGPMNSTPSPPVVFYLKYTKPEDAVRMLADLLDGGEAATDSQYGSLVNGYLSSSSSLLGSLITSTDGRTTMIAGTITVVADSRLNRVIAQGTTRDIELVENYLKIIDKDSSLIEIETYGTSHVLELAHANATEVAEVIRDAYGDRVAGSNKAGASNQQGAQARGQQPQPQPKKSDDGNSQTKKPAGKAPESKPTRSPEPKMTIAVHEKSNSLIVTAPESLFKEVEQLAEQLDLRSKKSVVVVPTTNVTAQLLLLKALSEEPGAELGGGSSSSKSTPKPPASRSKSDR